MKKKVIIIYVILILIVIKLTTTFFINESFISKYNKGIYNENQIKKLFFLNIFQSYIAHYNYGNVLYQKEDYDGAIKEYQKALKANPPRDKECSIRINLALAMIAKIDENEKTEEKINELNEARKTLCEKGCANENDNLGHSDTAEKLKSDIDKIIEALQNSNTEEQEESSETEEEEQEEIKQNLDKIQEQLEKIQKEARESRQEDLEYIRSSADYEYYSGKRW